MPRQGARRKARQSGEAGGRRGAKASREQPGEGDPDRAEDAKDEAPLTARAAAASSGPGADFEAALKGPGDTAEKLFDLASKPAVRFSIAGGYVQVAQDRNTTEHSGGVVWETAFFLARYLEQHVLPKRGADGQRCLRIAELGSGCGLLGLALARLGCRVILTEQPAALENLKSNVVAHKASSGGGGGGIPKAMQLSWGEDADIAAVGAKGPFDLIVASDVVFAARFVEPLLKTIAALLAARGDEASGAAPECWLCLQQRDPDAHKELMARAPAFFKVSELSFDELPGFEAAAELECLLLRLRLKKRRKEAEDVPADGGSAPAAKKSRAGK